MNYRIDEKGIYIADDGYVFEKNGSIAKMMALSELDNIDNYNVIEEPVEEEIIEEVEE